MHSPKLAVALLLALSSVSHAGDPTPLSTWTYDFGAFDFNGPGVAVSPFGPVAGEPVWNARVFVDFDANGAMPASTLLFQVVLPLESGTAVWNFTGADLGFPASGGAFQGEVETDLLEGVVFNPTPLPGAPMDILLSTSGGQMVGHLEAFTLTLEIAPRLDALGGQISVGAGGAQPLHLNAGPSAGSGAAYLVLGSLSGTSPGLPIDGVNVPLNWDAYTTLLISGPNPGFLPASLGILDGQGVADTAFQLPPASNPGLAGLTLHHACLVPQLPSGPLLSASNPVAVALVP